MKIQDILKYYQEDKILKNLVEEFDEGSGKTVRLKGLHGSQRAFVFAALFRIFKKNALVVCNDKEDALYFLNDIQGMLSRKDILFFPASYKRPYQLEEIDNANILQRAEVLNLLNHTASGHALIVTFPEALSEKVINRKSLVKNTFEIKTGDHLDLDFLVDLLSEYGFDRTDFVYEAGQFSVRGGILDLYSFSAEFPYRMEFDGDIIESIRSFDPADQLSKEDIPGISLIPNIQTRLKDEERVTFLEYISPSTVIYLRDLESAIVELDKFYERAQNHYQENKTKTGGISVFSAPNKLYYSGSEFVSELNRFNVLEFGSRSYFRKSKILEFAGNPQESFHKDFNLLAQHLHHNHESGIQNFIVTENEKQLTRLREIFKELDKEAVFEGIQGELHEGFLDKERLIACYTDHQIFERYHRYKVKASYSKTKALTLKELRELKPGDYVTHVTHGIGKFGGLETVKAGESEQEAIRIFYEGGDSIYVNVNALYKVSKFSGSEGSAPRLNKLGSQEWSKAKSKAKKKIKDLAFDLINLYARRKAQPGFQFSHENYLQTELEASFLYEDTPDQQKATEAVKGDMEQPHPMDRLICGDVGFGKTEIAVRAAFKAVTDGKQVAILVPTTILALQHHRTFSDRLKNFPVTVEFLNRFKTAKEQKDILERIKNGRIDILIGTHRLISEDVIFKDLGLMIIDEEQKFGVGIKEKLKTTRVNIDTLTLTATPIPRTLQFSLLGVRDLSIIATPPPNRQPVQTILENFEPEVIRDAIAYELKRGGQVFFVHHRIKELEEIAGMIKKLVPDARIAIGHGQLTGPQIEKVMVNFIEGEYDVLVSTTIVESGLDIPNANTIIINKAHLYGMSDIHQMRGRVGRSNKKAFCYLLSPPLSTLTSDARKRLSAIEEFSDLGSGLQVAMRDLDIRGAGDMLGAEQSGFINEIGYEMYHKILDEAVYELKEESFSELFADELKNRRKEAADDCQVDTDLQVLIPNDYVNSISERMNFYQQISSAETESEIQAISRNMLDRFGKIPEPVLALFDTIRIRELGKSFGFEKIIVKNGTIKGNFISDSTSPFYSSGTFSAILAFVQKGNNNIRLRQAQKNLVLEINNITSVKETWVELSKLKAFVEQFKESNAVS